MFDLKAFIKKELLHAVDKQKKYEVAMLAAYWFEKRVLNDTDMEDIVRAMYPVQTEDEWEDLRREIPPGFAYDYCDIAYFEPLPRNAPKG